MASEKDLKHFENIKNGMARLELESLKKEMAMTSGERILAAIRLSDALISRVGIEKKPPPISLISILRKRRAT